LGDRAGRHADFTSEIDPADIVEFEPFCEFHGGVLARLKYYA